MTNKNRFYDQTIKPFEHEPTRDRFSIVGTIEKGQGLISLIDLEPGQIVFRFAGPQLAYQTLFTLQKKPGVYIEDPMVMGKVLHACDPNMHCDMSTQTFTALKPIKRGDMLTMDYESTEDELFRSFECCCGADNCRQFIHGRLKASCLKTA